VAVTDGRTVLGVSLAIWSCGVLPMTGASLPVGSVIAGLPVVHEDIPAVVRVVGHEIAHVAQKHSLDAFKKQFWTSVFFGVIDAPATVLTLGQVGATGMNGTTNFVLSEMERNEEYYIPGLPYLDRLELHIMAVVGNDVEEMMWS